MSWPATLGVGVVAGVAGMFVAGYTANLAVSWYRISSFEGQSGYFVAFLGLAGLATGALVGVVTARVLSGGFLFASAGALGVVLGLGLAVGGAARLLADVPPEVRGDTLLLALEYRWPAAQVDEPSGGEAEPRVQLGSVSGSTERKSAVGPFWLGDSRQEDGRWISPGAVQLFTERGQRAVSWVVDDVVVSGVLVPLPRRPDAEHLQWSGWLPVDGSGGADGASYRFRVHRSSEPIRVEKFGPFDVELIATAFWGAEDPDGRRRIDVTGGFGIRHHGERVVVERAGMYGSTASPRIDRADAVAVVAADRPALIACMNRYDRPCFLLASEDAGLRTEHVADMQTGMAGFEVTADQTRFELSRQRVWSRSRLERGLFEPGRIYQLGTALLDTRDLRVLHVAANSDLLIQQWSPPIGLAPDGRSFVRVAGDVDGGTLLVVSDLDGSNAYTLPIDATRTPHGTADQIAPAWLTDHFEWTPSDHGRYRLVERSGVLPISRD